MRRLARVPAPRSGFAGFRFPPAVIMVAVRWYLRYGLSYRDVEELLAERGIAVDHVTIYRWVQRFTPLLIDAARPCRHAPGDRWFVDETYVKVAGRWVYLYRAIDQDGQVIDVLVSPNRDLSATRRFFTRALENGSRPNEVTTDQAPAYPRVIEELIPAACHVTEQYANNPVEARSWASEGPAAPDARSETAALGTGGQYRARVRAEPLSRPLRTRLGYRSTVSARSDLHRTRPRHLIEAAQQRISPASRLRNRP
jgi:IS6 family transposase